MKRRVGRIERMMAGSSKSSFKRSSTQIFFVENLFSFGKRSRDSGFPPLKFGSRSYLGIRRISKVR